MRLDHGQRNRGQAENMAAMTVSDPALVTLARRHLPPAVAARWTALLRPGLRLQTIDPDAPGAVQLGGLPHLPDDVSWPRWKGHGPLSFVAAIDCAHLPSQRLDITLPESGRLLLFYRDPQLDDFQPVIDTRTPQTQAGARIVYVPTGTPTTKRDAPAGIKPYPRVRLTAEPIITGPDWEHPALKAAVQDLPDEDRAFMNNPANSDPFRLALGEQATMPRHRIGGYAAPVQGSVEVDVAQVQLGGQVAYTDPALYQEAQRWTLLAQIDTDADADMMWGDCGTLYWLIPRDDLAAHRFHTALFTWQCS
jgi:uncharacterized protein YwqG